MDAQTILAIIAAAQQLVEIAIKQKALLETTDQASVDAALASLRATSDALHEASQSL